MNEALVISNILAWTLLVALSVVVFALARQVGLLHERIRPAGALASGGPEVGQSAPRMELATLDGAELSLGGRSGRQTLLLFVSPTCPVCKTLLPTALRTVVDEPTSTRLVLAGDGSADEHRSFVAAHGLAALPFVVSTELGLAFRVGKLPYAVLIDGVGIVRAKGIVNTREHLESLFEASEKGVASIQEYAATRAEKAA